MDVSSKHELFFAVTEPGNVVVIQNIIPAGFGQENVEARYELLGRGTYSSTQTRIENAIFGVDQKTPRILFEARNALRIARSAAAEKYSAPILSRADQQLQQAEVSYQHNQGTGAIQTAARNAIETAGEARVMAVKKEAEEEASATRAAP